MITDISIRIYGFVTGLLHREEGQDLVEYAVLVGLIGIVAALGIATILNSGIWETFAGEIEDCITFDTVNCQLT